VNNRNQQHKAESWQLSGECYNIDYTHFTCCTTASYWKY